MEGWRGGLSRLGCLLLLLLLFQLRVAASLAWQLSCLAYRAPHLDLRGCPLLPKCPAPPYACVPIHPLLRHMAGPPGVRG